MSSWFSLWWENSCLWHNLVSLWLKFSGCLCLPSICVGYMYIGIVLVICTSELCWLCVHWNVLVMCTLELCWLWVHQNCIGYVYFGIVLVMKTLKLCWLCVHWDLSCIAFPGSCSLQVLWYFVSVYEWLSRAWIFDTFCLSLLILWCLIWLLSFFKLRFGLSLAIWSVLENYPCAPEIKMYLPVDTWSDVVCDSQVKYLIWTCSFAWVSCPVIKVWPWSSKLLLHLSPHFSQT